MIKLLPVGLNPPIVTTAGITQMAGTHTQVISALPELHQWPVPKLPFIAAFINISSQ